MKPGTFIVAAGLVLAAVAVGAPASAQSARIVVGAVFGAGPQHRQPAPDAQRQAPYLYPERPGPVRSGRYDGHGAREYARSRGFNDGYEQGFEAARHRDRFDPRRERWYRDAERGYDRDYRMPRSEYRDIYRRGFVDGYESGFRDAQRGWRGGYRSGGGYGRDRGWWR